MNGNIGRSMMPTQFEIIADTAEHTYSYQTKLCTSFMVLTDEVEFSILEKNNKSLTDAEKTLFAENLVHGDIIPANWTSIKLSSGAVIAFTQ